MEGEGRVVVSAEVVRLPESPDAEARDAILVEVADNGPGMAPEVADKVFAPFFTTKAKGSGLGLAIVRKIVDAHDGTIDMRTAPDGGTAIRVTLPVQAEEA
jgi:signal transduction histidine kinase